MGYINLNEITEEASEEAKRLIKNLDRKSHPFRDRFEHTMRVLKWAERIHKIEGDDFEVIKFAVLFHDAGWSDTVDHALIGAELAEKYLLGKDVDPELVARIVSAVLTHNKIQEPEESLPKENLIVMDADGLDEVGVTTLVWDAMATATEDNPSYMRVLERDKEFYKQAKENIIYLETETGKKFYNERIAVLEMCLSHFRYELSLSDEFTT